MIIIQPKKLKKDQNIKKKIQFKQILMTYKLKFTKESQKDWNKLDSTIKEQFKKKLKQRIENPKVPKDKLSGYENVYKIKLRSVGYRLAYEVKDEEIVILVLSVGKRENNSIYENLKKRKEDDKNKQKAKYLSYW
eukprot:TRINITY_DN127007_c0_g1_i1.p3 TRINITY_DN127007_c0_g1~~TRINITY_DN127007_c0_g1_i1.p3  ORF type:complete len:135 (-),score=17.32 TRINITY_DN127007_c0_g1_i1:418-822(-)